MDPANKSRKILLVDLLEASKKQLINYAAKNDVHLKRLLEEKYDKYLKQEEVNSGKSAFKSVSSSLNSRPLRFLDCVASSDSASTDDQEPVVYSLKNYVIISGMRYEPSQFNGKEPGKGFTVRVRADVDLAVKFTLEQLCLAEENIGVMIATNEYYQDDETGVKQFYIGIDENQTLLVRSRHAPDVQRVD